MFPRLPLEFRGATKLPQGAIPCGLSWPLASIPFGSSGVAQLRHLSTRCTATKLQDSKWQRSWTIMHCHWDVKVLPSNPQKPPCKARWSVRSKAANQIPKLSGIMTEDCYASFVSLIHGWCRAMLPESQVSPLDSSALVTSLALDLRELLQRHHCCCPCIQVLLWSMIWALPSLFGMCGQGEARTNLAVPHTETFIPRSHSRDMYGYFT